jgi:hypothetical protein
MKPDARFVNLPKSFWACVRTIGQHLGYTARGAGCVSVPTIADMERALQENNLAPHLIGLPNGAPTELGSLLAEYFRYRADTLNHFVEPRLMDVSRARSVFEKVKRELRPKCPIPMNKQKGEKKTTAYLTGLVNMLIDANRGGFPCNYDPRSLTTVTKEGVPVRTLARRVDGAFPSVVNPIAVWEVKEYYHTTTFGSRVADGVYETLLDGMEFAELREHEGIKVLHYLVLDAHYTWWDCGRSYLCRVFDTLHMGYVDEVLFGHEVIERLPEIVCEWVKIAKEKGISKR